MSPPWANPAFVAFDPNIKMNYVEQYNLTLERQITNSLGLRVTYLGQNFKHTWRAYDANQPREFGPGPIQSRRPLSTRWSAPAASVEATAAAPNNGHAQPNTAGSPITCFAITGTKVAGMM